MSKIKAYKSVHFYRILNSLLESLKTWHKKSTRFDFRWWFPEFNDQRV